MAKLNHTGRRISKSGTSSHSLNLADSVRIYPTPNCFDAIPDFGDRKDSNLEEEAKLGNYLNPDWVEWLMGWPIGWTSPDSLDGLEFPTWDKDPADDGGVPRVTGRSKTRVPRLKAIGNGQVPQCVAVAWRILNELIEQDANNEKH